MIQHIRPSTSNPVGHRKSDPIWFQETHLLIGGGGGRVGHALKSKVWSPGLNSKFWLISIGSKSLNLPFVR